MYNTRRPLIWSAKIHYR